MTSNRDNQVGARLMNALEKNGAATLSTQWARLLWLHLMGLDAERESERELLLDDYLYQFEVVDKRRVRVIKDYWPEVDSMCAEELKAQDMAECGHPDFDPGETTDALPAICTAPITVSDSCFDDMGEDIEDGFYD